MDLVALIGDDDSAISREREALLAKHPSHEYIDVAQDKGTALLLAVRTPAMFGPRVVAAENLESFDKTLIADLKDAGPRSDTTVIARAGGTLSPTLRAALSAIGEVRRIDLPKGAALAGALNSTARELGLSLSNDARAALSEVPLPRAREALELLAAAGITNPGSDEVAAALSGEKTQAAPWDLTDALDAGNRAKLFALTSRVAPVPGISFLTTHLTRLGRLAEAGVRDPGAASELLGLKQRFQAERLVRTARRYRPEQIYAALDLCAELSLAVRSTGAEASFAAGVLRLADVLS